MVSFHTASLNIYFLLLWKNTIFCTILNTTEYMQSLIYKGDVKRVHECLKSQPELAKKPVDRFLNTPLHLAARGNAVEMAELLIEYAADVKAGNENLITPLHDAVLATTTGKVKHVVDVLLANKADPNAFDHFGKTPFFLAAVNNNFINVPKLVVAKANVNVKGGKDGSTPLLVAAEKNMVAMGESLMRYGAENSIVNVHKDSPLHVAVRERHEEFVDMLLHYIPLEDLQIRNVNQRTPLDELFSVPEPDRCIMILLLKVIPTLEAKYATLALKSFKPRLYVDSLHWPKHSFKAYVKSAMKTHYANDNEDIFCKLNPNVKRLLKLKPKLPPPAGAPPSQWKLKSKLTHTLSNVEKDLCLHFYINGDVDVFYKILQACFVLKPEMTGETTPETNEMIRYKRRVSSTSKNFKHFIVEQIFQSTYLVSLPKQLRLHIMQQAPFLNIKIDRLSTALALVTATKSEDYQNLTRSLSHSGLLHELDYNCHL